MYILFASLEKNQDVGLPSLDERTLLKVIQELSSVFPVGILRSSSGNFKVKISSKEEVFKIISNASLSNKLSGDFSLQYKMNTPLDYRASCCVVYSRPFSVHSCLSDSDFVKNFNQKNPNRKLDSIFSFFFKTDSSKKSAIKLRFSSPASASAVLKEGFFLENMKVNSSQLSEEIFVEIQQCLKCYQFGHSFPACSSLQQFCSICGVPGHWWKDCKNSLTPNCLLCKQNHPAVDWSCPVRKDFVSSKKALLIKALSSRSPTPTITQPVSPKQNFASAVKGKMDAPPNQDFSPLPSPSASQIRADLVILNECEKIAASIASKNDREDHFALFMEILQHNGLPTIKLPDNLKKKYNSSALSPAPVFQPPPVVPFTEKGKLSDFMFKVPDPLPVDKGRLNPVHRVRLDKRKKYIQPMYRQDKSSHCSKWRPGEHVGVDNKVKCYLSPNQIEVCAHSYLPRTIGLEGKPPGNAFAAQEFDHLSEPESLAGKIGSSNN